MSDQSPFQAWLNRRYIEWEASTGKKQKIASWARHIGVNRDLLNQWLLGSGRPGPKGAKELAASLGPEVYDLLGLERPDPLLQAVIDNWKRLTREQQEDIARSVGESGGYPSGTSGGSVAKTNTGKEGRDRTPRRSRSSGKVR